MASRGGRKGKKGRVKRGQKTPKGQMAHGYTGPRAQMTPVAGEEDRNTSPNPRESSKVIFKPFALLALAGLA